MIRGIVTAMIEGVIKRFSASGRSDETFESREYFQHYGFTSRALPGAEIIVIQEGNHLIAVASDDRRYRLAMANGEVALYDHLGQHFHLKSDGTVDVVGVNEVRVIAPLVKVVASTKVRLETPLLEVTGNITAGGNINDATRPMSADRDIYNGHTHTGDSGGTTGTPNQEM